ncbi:MAG TPA: glycosyltransferase 87 family protein [Streptosporangiaceae bacterium]|nr:glycosyltransferase 87 family protein [Streptosporangiaceae bacterium]
MTYRARHARPATLVSPQVRGRASRTGHERAVSLSARIGRAGTPLLVFGAAAFAAAIARLVLHAAEPSFLSRMFDLGILRDGGLIVRHAYHFRSGHPTPLYQWVSPGGGNPFIYPPFAALLFAGMSFLSPLVLKWGMTALSLGALVAAIWLTLAGVGVPKGRARAGLLLAASAAAMWIQPVQANLGLGQVNLLLMAAIIWDLRPAAADRLDAPSRWWTGIATGVAAGIKLTPLIFIPYLLVTHRFRQAGVAAAAFAATVGAGFAAMPGASAAYWQSGLLDRANGTPKANAEFFFASARNQSLRGYLSRLLQHAQVAAGPWLIAAALTLITGLACAAWLHRDGYPMLGVLTCALTGLLISPISWLHHWVWAGPWLAALGGLALLARGASWRIWAGAAGLITLAFGSFPVIGVLTGTQSGLNVVTDVPLKQPLSWHGAQVIAGNIYVFSGVAGLLALFGWGIVRAYLPGPGANRVPASPPPMPTNVEVIPRVMTYRD